MYYCSSIGSPCEYANIHGFCSITACIRSCNVTVSSYNTSSDLAREYETLRERLQRYENMVDQLKKDLVEAAVTPCSYCLRSPVNGGSCDMKNDSHDMVGYTCWRYMRG